MQETADICLNIRTLILLSCNSAFEPNITVKHTNRKDFLVYGSISLLSGEQTCVLDVVWFSGFIMSWRITCAKPLDKCQKCIIIQFIEGSFNQRNHTKSAAADSINCLDKAGLRQTEGGNSWIEDILNVYSALWWRQKAEEKRISQIKSVTAHQLLALHSTQDVVKNMDSTHSVLVLDYCMFWMKSHVFVCRLVAFIHLHIPLRFYVLNI